MADVLTKEQRHINMSHIRGRDTSIEVKLRKALFARGFRFRKNVSKMIGKPDIVLPKYKTVIFIHGCFWHRHPGCRYVSTPKTRRDFWEEKFNRNVLRDKHQAEELINAGWHVLVVWECEIKHDIEAVADELKKIMSYMIPVATKKLYIPSLSCFMQSPKINCSNKTRAG